MMGVVVVWWWWCIQYSGWLEKVLLVYHHQWCFRLVVIQQYIHHIVHCGKHLCYHVN